MARQGAPPTRNCPAWLGVKGEGKDRRYAKRDGVEIEGRNLVGVVQQIFTMAAAGMGEMAITRKLNDDETLNFRGEKWKTGQINHIVMSKAPLGIMVSRAGGHHEGTEEFMHYPEIIDPTTWRAAQQARKANRYTKQNWAEAEQTGALLPPVKNLFPRLLFCAHCHGKMAFNASTPRKGAPQRFRLYCIKGKNKSGCKATKAGISYTVLEKAILSRIEYADRNGLLNTDPTEEIRMADLKIDRIEIALKTANDQLDMLTLAGKSKSVMDKLAAKGEEIAKLEMALREAKDSKPARTMHDNTEALAELRAAAEAGDYTSRMRVRLALNSVVDRISCDVLSGFVFVWVARGAYSFIVDTRGLDEATSGTCFDLSYVIERFGEEAVASVMNDPKRMRVIIAQFGKFLEEDAAKEEAPTLAPTRGRRLRIPAQWQYEEGDE